MQVDKLWALLKAWNLKTTISQGIIVVVFLSSKPVRERAEINVKYIGSEGRKKSHSIHWLYLRITVGQRLTLFNPWTKSILPSVFEKKAILEHHHTHFFIKKETNV